MSAYICNPEHIGALAAFLEYNKDRGYGRDAKNARDNAEILMKENIRSVATRYPNDKDGNRPGPCGMTDSDLVSESRESAQKFFYRWPQLTAVDILKMCDGLEYQSCETDNWQDTEACKLLNKIRSSAIRNYPAMKLRRGHTVIKEPNMDKYLKRVRELEDEGLTTSDAQGAADVEFMKIERGALLADVLGLKLKRNGRYATQWGYKTPLGLFLTAKRIIDTGK